MALVHVSIVLPASADRVWELVKVPASFRFVTRGLIRFPAFADRASPFREGDVGSGLLLVFGVLPFSRHRIALVELDDDRRLLRSDEAGGLIRHWRHDISVTPIDEHTCHYVDRIDIDAGAFTPAVRLFAGVFYRLRQRRWHQLAAVVGAADRAGTQPDEIPVSPGDRGRMG